MARRSSIQKAIDELNFIEQALENHAQLAATKSGRLVIVPEVAASYEDLRNRGLTQAEALAQTKYHYDALNALVGDLGYSITNQPFRGLKKQDRRIPGLTDALFNHNLDNSAFVMRQGRRAPSSTERTAREQDRILESVLGDMFTNTNPATGVNLGQVRTIDTPQGPVRRRSALDLEHLIPEKILKSGEFMDPRISNREYNLYLGNASANRAKRRFATEIILHPTPEDVADLLFGRYAEMEKLGLKPTPEHAQAILEQRKVTSERPDIRILNMLLDAQHRL